MQCCDATARRWPSAHAGAALPRAHDAVLDDFRDATAWQAGASDQVQASVRGATRAARCACATTSPRVSGYAVLRRELPIELPAHFVLVAAAATAAARPSLQFKLVDASGDNVWW